MTYSLLPYTMHVSLILVGGLFCCCQATKNSSGKAAIKLVVTSQAFSDGQRLPVQYTCEGKDLSPQLAWAGAPSKTKSVACICDDPDAPSGDWVHWVIFNIPPTATGLPEGVAKVATLSDGTVQGINDFGALGYGGACPPKGHGTHHYQFRVYALDQMLSLGSGITKKQLIAAMHGHILASGMLVGTYSRS